MPFLPANQQRQSTEGKNTESDSGVILFYIYGRRFSPPFCM